MVTIKIKELVKKITRTDGKPYVMVVTEDGQKYFVWEQFIPLLNGVNVGDEVDVELVDKGKSTAIEALSVSSGNAPGSEEDPMEDYDHEFSDDEIPEPPEAPIKAPVPPRSSNRPGVPPVKPAVQPAAQNVDAKTPTAPVQPKPAAVAPKPAAPAPAPAAPKTPGTVAPVVGVTVALPTYSGRYEQDTEDFSENPNMDLYQKLRSVPGNAQRAFTRGSFSGTDINPMWRIRKMTETFGPIGVGWKYTVDKQWTENCGGTIVAFVNISLFYRTESGEWSDPVPGNGGSILFDQAGANDEAFKMAETDAFGKACQKLGLGANVYWADGTSKYTN